MQRRRSLFCFWTGTLRSLTSLCQASFTAWRNSFIACSTFTASLNAHSSNNFSARSLNASTKVCFSFSLLHSCLIFLLAFYIFFSSFNLLGSIYLFIIAELWENAIEFSNELRLDCEKETFDYRAVADLLVSCSAYLLSHFFFVSFIDFLICYLLRIHYNLFGLLVLTGQLSGYTKIPIYSTNMFLSFY